jgi:hypothetical protein
MKKRRSEDRGGGENVAGVTSDEDERDTKRVTADSDQDEARRRKVVLPATWGGMIVV